MCGNGDVSGRIWKEQCGNEYNVNVKEFIVMLLNNVYCVIWGNGQLAKSVIPSNTLLVFLWLMYEYLQDYSFVSVFLSFSPFFWLFSN